MKTLILVLTSLILVACGKPMNQEQDADTTRSVMVSSCIEAQTPTVSDEADEIPHNAIRLYCECVTDSAMEKFSKDELKSLGPSKIASQLLSDGTIERCMSEARNE